MGGRTKVAVVKIILMVVMVVVVLLEVITIAKVGVGPVSPLREDFEEEKVIWRFEKRVGGEASAVVGENLQTRVTREDKESVFGRFDRTFSTSGEASYAFAHKANHPPRGKTPNVMICMHDYDVNEGAREALRMMNMDTEDPQKLERMAHFVRAAIPERVLKQRHSRLRTI